MGLNILKFMKLPPKAVNSNGAVSPVILATLRRIPVMIPLNPAGTMTFMIVLE